MDVNTAIMPNGYNIASLCKITVLIFIVLAVNCQMGFADINPLVLAALERSNPIPQVHPANRIPDLIEAANTLTGSPQELALIDLSATIRKVSSKERQKVFESISALLSRNESYVKFGAAYLLKNWASELSPKIRTKLIASMQAVSSNGTKSEASTADVILAHMEELSISGGRNTPTEPRSGEKISPSQTKLTIHAPLSGKEWLELFSDELAVLTERDRESAEKISTLARSGQQRQAQVLLERLRSQHPRKVGNSKGWAKTFERESLSWPDIYAKDKTEIRKEFKSGDPEKALDIFNAVKIRIANSKTWLKNNSRKLEELEEHWKQEVFEIKSYSMSLDVKYANSLLTALSVIDTTRSEHINFLTSHADKLNTIEASDSDEIADLKAPRFGQSKSQLESKFTKISINTPTAIPTDNKSGELPLGIKFNKRSVDTFQSGLCLIFVLFLLESVATITPGKACFGLFNSGANSLIGSSLGLCIRFFIKYSWLITWITLKTIYTMNNKGFGLVFDKPYSFLETPITFALMYCLINLLTLATKGVFLHDSIGGTEIHSVIEDPVEKTPPCTAFGTRPEKIKIKKSDGSDDKEEKDLPEDPTSGPFELRSDDGALEAKGYLCDGNLDGEVTYFGVNGRISRSSYYACGKLHGLTITFDEVERPILYECYINGDIITRHTKGTLGFWLSRKTTCLEMSIGRRSTALVLDYNLCLLSVSAAKFFLGVGIPITYGMHPLIPILPELFTRISIGKGIMRISSHTTILPTRGRALIARWFVKHYPLCLLIITYQMLATGSLPLSISPVMQASIALAIVGSILAGFGIFNYLCLRSTGVLFHTLVSNPQIATVDQTEKVRILDVVPSKYYMKHRITILRCMALAFDVMLIQTILGLMF